MNYRKTVVQILYIVAIAFVIVAVVLYVQGQVEYRRDRDKGELIIEQQRLTDSISELSNKLNKLEINRQVIINKYEQVRIDIDTMSVNELEEWFIARYKTDSTP